MPRKLSYEYVKYLIESESGYRLLSKEYINAESKLLIQCPLGHIVDISYHNWQKGHRCRFCYYEHQSVVMRNDIIIIRQTFEEMSFTIIDNLNEVYRDGFTKIKVQCPKGHISNKSYHSVQHNHGCKQCAMENSISSQQEYIYKIFNKGILNYPFNRRFLDIALPEERIFIEYDGRGHDMRVGKSISLEYFLNDETNRYLMLKNNSWRGIRIISRHDKLPDKYGLYELLNSYYIKLRDDLDIYLITIDIDNEIITINNNNINSIKLPKLIWCSRKYLLDNKLI